MRQITGLIAGFAFACSAAGQAAERSPVPGAWHVTGDVAGRSFALDCRFNPAAGGFGGDCTELASSDARGTPGKVHRLNKGSQSGAQISWSYPVTIIFMRLDIGFAGKVEGDRISGTTSAAGRKGSFSAIRTAN